MPHLPSFPARTPAEAERNAIDPPRIIARHCLAALWAELRATPKPGLVDLADSGAHRDMDKNTFSRAIKALSPFFYELARAGWEGGPPGPHLLPGLREIGLAAEQAMYAATGGVNTHKGAIFSLGLIAAAAAGLLRKHTLPLTAEAVCRGAASLVGSTLSELSPAAAGEGALSHGLLAFRRHGLTGARGEAAAGFPAVLHQALPVLRAARRDGHPSGQARLQALLSLLLVTQDTNLVSRGGVAGLHTVRRLAGECLAQGGAFTERGRRLLKKMNRIFIAENLSPGGAADLLSVALSLQAIENNSRLKIFLERFPDETALAGGGEGGNHRRAGVMLNISNNYPQGANRP